MPKTKILNENVSDLDMAAALREHAEDRDRLLVALTEAFQNDPLVRAFWLWGSFGRGDADDLSDLDLWIAVPDNFVSKMGVRLLEQLIETGVLISALENAYNAPAGGGYIGCLFAGRRGMIHVDLYWQGQSTIDDTPDISVLFKGLPGASRNMLSVFNRRHEPTPSIPPISRCNAVDQTAPHTALEKQLAFVYLMFSIAAKYLARDLDSDLTLILYPKPAFEEAVDLTGVPDVVGVVDWSLPGDALGKVARLKHLAAKAGLLIERIESQGGETSSLYVSCLDRYLEMVEKIVVLSRER